MKNLAVSLKSKLLGASILALAVASVRGGSTSVTYPVTLGNTYIGSKATYGVTAQNSSTLASYAATAAATGNFLAASGNLVSASYTHKLSSGVPSVNCSLAVGNYTVLSQTSSAASTTFNVTSSQTFISANTTLSIVVGGVTYPISLKGTLAGSGSVDLVATTNTSAKSITVSGTISDTAAGAATAALPSTTAAIGSVTGNLNLGASTLNANATVSTTAQSGVTTLSLAPLNLAFNVVLTSSKTGATITTANLASYVAAARTISLLNL